MMPVYSASFAAARRNPIVLGIIVPICQTMVWNMLVVLVLPDQIWILFRKIRLRMLCMESTRISQDPSCIPRYRGISVGRYLPGWEGLDSLLAQFYVKDW